ncbi:MAG: 30S ribosomal protein S16 [Candidatus Moranbacteria bacterium]|nr:30S ribosomal protein S16 [Candidatus Moranbacteria bacterium]
MLAIRLSRFGKNNFPFFRVVVMDKRKSAKGRALEVLGSVNPRNKDIVLKNERIQYWLGVGAEASDRVYNILVSQKIIEGKKRPKKIRAKKKEEKEAEAAPAAPAAAPEKSQEAAEKPVEEKPAEEKSATGGSLPHRQASTSGGKEEKPAEKKEEATEKKPKKVLEKAEEKSENKEEKKEEGKEEKPEKK